MMIIEPMHRGATALADYAGATRTGRHRKRNEDALGMVGDMFVVADGCGGLVPGERPSDLAIAAVLGRFAEGVRRRSVPVTG
ncbi:MAG: hypothetical protein JNL82_23875 [Myxococcales bacterium]|nr:hypothetical protein [Myxococcales bacterium]